MNNKFNSKSVSISLPRLSSRSTTFLTSSTDDVSFAQNQINKITRSNDLREYYKLKPWEKSMVSVFKEEGKSNFMLLSDIRKKISIENKSVKDINWSNQKYFTQEQLDKFFDASQIMRRVNNKKQCKEPFIDLFTYASQSKEICVRNMLIDLMNEERRKISRNQKEISNALQQSICELNNDIVLFDNFKEEMKKKAKETELVLNKVIQSNKKLIEKKKKHTQEHRLILDEIEKMIRQIINMKFYAMFVHNLLGGGENIVSCSLGDTIEIKNNREKELEEYSNQIFKEFNFLRHEQIDDNDDVLKDPLRIMNIYDQFEANIIKLISQKEEYDKEAKTLQEQSDDSLKDLRIKVKLHEDELAIFSREVEKVQEQICEIEKKSLHDEFVQFSACMINDIANTLIEMKIAEKNTNETKISKVIDNTMDSLNKMETQINDYISNLEQCENDKIFFECVEKRKKENKFLRHIQEKKLITQKQEDRAHKLNEKMTQFVIRGRGRFPMPIPPHILKMRKKLVVKHDEDDDEYQMLEYH